MKYLLLLLFIQSDIQCWYCHVEIKSNKIEYYTQTCGQKTKQEAEKSLRFDNGTKVSCVKVPYSPFIL